MSRKKVKILENYLDTRDCIPKKKTKRQRRKAEKQFRFIETRANPNF